MFKCKFCNKKYNDHNSFANHEYRCPKNLNRKYKNGMKGKKGCNASIKAKMNNTICIVTEETREKMRQSRIGTKLSTKTKEKISLKLKNKKSNFKGKKHRQESMIKSSISHINNPNKKFNNTSIEQKIAKKLKQLNIEYKQNIGLENIANVDFYLPKYNIVIFCDGCYYHNCSIHFPEKYKERRIRDKEQTEKLNLLNYIIYRFWEHEINESPENCIKKIGLLDQQ